MALCMDTFRERIDFEVENTVPVAKAFSAKVAEMIEKNSTLIATQAERDVTDNIMANITTGA